MAGPTGQALRPDASPMGDQRLPERDETMKGSEARAASRVVADAGRGPRLCRRNGQPAQRRVPLAAWALAAVFIFGPLTVGVPFGGQRRAPTNRHKHGALSLFLFFQ